ncbi:hypothetical protein V6X63_10115 [Spiribacter sp. 221]
MSAEQVVRIQTAVASGGWRDMRSRFWLFPFADGGTEPVSLLARY